MIFLIPFVPIITFVISVLLAWGVSVLLKKNFSLQTQEQKEVSKGSLFWSVLGSGIVAGVLGSLLNNLWGSTAVTSFWSSMLVAFVVLLVIFGFLFFLTLRKYVPRKNVLTIVIIVSTFYVIVNLALGYLGQVLLFNILF